MFPRRQHTIVVYRGGDLNQYQRPGAERLQRPLVPRSRFRRRLMPSAHHYTFLEGIDGAMDCHRIDELMEPLVALPDRCDARLAVARAGEEAPELG
jgi:hypothetical protein